MPVPRVQAAQKRKKRCGCGWCCTILLGLLLVFLLVPRTPTVWLNELDIGNGSPSGKFEFENNNYFGVKWSDTKFSLYWLPNDMTLIGKKCSLTGTANDACEFYDRLGYCAINVGEFNGDEKFTTDSRVRTVRELPMTQTDQEAACSVNMATAVAVQSIRNLPQRLVTRGTVEAKGTVRNFGKIKVSDAYYYWN